MSIARHHAEWLSLVEVAGPFLSMPVLLKVLPQGLDAHDSDHVRSLRLAYEEWEENRDGPRPKAAVHDAGIRFVLGQTLGLPGEVLVENQKIPQTIKAPSRNTAKRCGPISWSAIPMACLMRASLGC
jgi:hypothetical protein